MVRQFEAVVIVGTMTARNVDCFLPRPSAGPCTESGEVAVVDIDSSALVEIAPVASACPALHWC